MATFAKIYQGTRARKPVSVDLPGCPTTVVDMRPLTGAEDLLVFKTARAMATARGVESPKEGEPIYDLCVMAGVVQIGCLDHESPAENPAPFFDSVEQVLSLGRDHIVYLYEHHEAWQEQTSPRQKNLSAEEYIALVMTLATRGESDNLDPFVSWPRATLASCMRTMALQLVSSPPASLPLSSPPADSTATDSSPSRESEP